MIYTDLLKNQKGQSAIEYILLLVVVASIITALFSVIKTKYLGNIQKCTNASEKSKFLCKINSYLLPTGGAKKFQYYPFKK